MSLYVVNRVEFKEDANATIAPPECNKTLILYL